MIIPVGVYKGKGNTYVAVYNYQHDISVMLPPSLSDATHVEHFSYSKGGKKGGGDVFLLPKRDICFRGVAKNRKSFHTVPNGVSILYTSGDDSFVNNEQIRRAMDDYDVRIELLQGTGSEVITHTLADIADFCGEKTAKKARGSRVVIVDKIVPVTEAKWINPKWMVVGGKQWFEPECILEGNIDFGKGCVSSWIPQEGATFDGKTYTNYFAYYSGECLYCYADREHRCYPKTLYKFDRERLKKELMGACKLKFGKDTMLGRPVKILRFGKRTEAWSPESADNFVATLETMVETGTRGVIPTKFMPFNPELAKLLKRTNSSVLYSIGFDEFELGAVKRGCSNDWRIEQAMKYREAGVNSNLYLLIVAHLPPAVRELAVLESLGYGHVIPLQLLPMRFRTKESFRVITGENWDELKKKRMYNTPKKNSLVPVVVDNGWTAMVGNNKGNVRMCYHNGQTSFCGGCFQCKGSCKK